MNNKGNDILKQLMKKGVNIPCPDGVEIGPDVDPERISGRGVTVHSGCRIYGADTLILSGVELGCEAPATVINCQIGKDVKLGGGFFSESCFFDRAGMGSGAQVREACLLEEGARGAHSVGLKHTILLPFVTLGSLINFCDCLMAGGTDEKNHSEVGSAYIHFNYTVNQDKATPSLMGDVPKGVMMRQPPIFLGGQGGLVGPVKIGFGAAVGAGNIVRKDILAENTILIGQSTPNLTMPFNQGLYSNINRIVSRNIDYIANLISLRRWYLDIRSRLMGDSPMERALLKGAIGKLDMAIAERIKRLGQVADKMPRSVELHQKLDTGFLQKKAIQGQQEFFEKWEEVAQVLIKCLETKGETSKQEAFLNIIENAAGKNSNDYLTVIRGLTEDEANAGTAWLQDLTDQIKERALEVLPNFKDR